MNQKRILVIPFKDLHIEDVPIVGGKNASLGEMYRELNKKGVTVPNGFAITALAYRYFIESAGLKDKIHKILSDLDTTSTRNLMKRGKKVRNLILKAELPLDLQKEIIENYKLLSKESKEDYTDVAVRSSATAEDLPDASFAGQQETYLNVRGEKELLKSCKKCFASLFTNRAISYRVDKGFDHFTIALSIGVEKMAITIEDHYKKAMDIEWAKDGKTNKIYIVQARPETVQSQRNVNILEEYVLKEKGKILAKGQSVGSRIGSGKVRVIKNVSGIHDFEKGEVLVTEMTDPDWEPIMKIASAIVTDKGGRTCHAAIISRELGIPCLVGTDDATKKLKNGEIVTVSCANGEEGRVYEGKLKYAIEKHNLEKIPKTKTKIMMNLGNPEQAFEQSFIPNDGVGLAREEFIINSHIKIHPNALIDYEKLSDKNLKKKIDDLTFGYKDKKQFYIDKLAEGIAMIAAAFYPKDVIVRMSDFKTNEYRNLIGGELYEPKEDKSNDSILQNNRGRKKSSGDNGKRRIISWER